jgi:hypothetical protein
MQANFSKPSTALEAAAAGQFLSALTPLTALQELSVRFVRICCTDDEEEWRHVLLPTTVLQPLQHLTQLHLQL